MSWTRPGQQRRSRSNDPSEWCDTTMLCTGDF